jgi:predicted nucleotidyltransferase
MVRSTRTTRMKADLVHSLSEYCAQDRRIRLAYLFGSRVRGAVGPLSDYDVAFLVDGTMVPAERYHLAHEIGMLLGGGSVDLVILNTAPVELCYHIIAQGRRVYERDQATRVEFEANTLSRYGDMLPMLRQQKEAILKGERHGSGVQRYREALGQTLRVLAETRGPSKQTS